MRGEEARETRTQGGQTESERHTERETEGETDTGTNEQGTTIGEHTENAQLSRITGTLGQLRSYSNISAVQVVSFSP